MIVLLGSVQIQEGCVEQALALSQVHVRRSRDEPGCIAHAVYLDPEDPLRLVFVERWADQAALQVHFKVPDSLGFVGALTQLASAAPEMQIYTATQV
mgnify:CR=1 FL=1